MLKYTLEEIQTKVLEEISQRHKDLIEDSIANTDNTSLVVYWNDMYTTFENMSIIFSDLIELENE